MKVTGPVGFLDLQDYKREREREEKRASFLKIPHHPIFSYTHTCCTDFQLATLTINRRKARARDQPCLLFLQSYYLLKYYRFNYYDKILCLYLFYHIIFYIHIHFM